MEVIVSVVGSEEEYELRYNGTWGGIATQLCDPYCKIIGFIGVSNTKRVILCRDKIVSIHEK